MKNFQEWIKLAMKFLRFPKMDKKKCCAHYSLTHGKKMSGRETRKSLVFSSKMKKIPNDLYRCGRHGNNRSSPTSFF